MFQLSLDLGPSEFGFLYGEAANDPEYRRRMFGKARAKRGELSNDEKYRLRYDLFRKQRGCCAICGKHYLRLKPDRLETDHRTATINGGSNAPSNLWLLCSPCHRLKTSQDIALAKRLRGEAA